MTENNITPNDNVKTLLIQDEMKNCFLDYAMSVIVSRALPDVRDGLKPVHRRVLYAMHTLNNYHNRPFLKSARVVGDVIGKYHPHGDSAVYSTIVRMAQDFSLRYTLVDGQGNFGSIDGDNAAAMRYTEIRMQKMSEDMLQDIDKDTVDWQPNYDDSLKEPLVLPTRIPNLLINGSAGIAVGMATNIPPHNFKEIMNGLIAVIDNPSVEIKELMKIIPGPDFPTAGSIIGLEGIKSAYFTGRGVIQIRAKAEIESTKNDRERIVITELPYQVNKAKLIEKFAELVNEKIVTGVSDIRDESSREGIRVVLDLKKGEIGSVILNRLYKQTQLQVSFGIIFLSLHNGQPKVMDLKEQLQYFIDHRKEIVIRRTNYDLRKSKEKAHILEGLKIAVENIDSIVETIKKSDGPNEARKRLINQYGLSEIQSQAILDMRLQRITGLERDKIIKEYKEILDLIKHLEGILASDELVLKIIREEFLEISNQYSDERRTNILPVEGEITLEDMIKDEEVIVTVTRKGYVKRMAIDTYKAQRRGGRGVKGADLDLDDDFYIKLFTTSTLSTILVFTNKGTVFSLKVYSIPEAARISRGRNIINLLHIPPGENVVAVVPIPEKKENSYLIFSTVKGTVKRTSLNEYGHIKHSGLRGIKIIDGDSLLDVSVSDGSKDILLCSTSGKSIRFHEADCRAVGRVSQGVRGIDIEANESIVGMELIDDTVEILSVTENGYGKRTIASEYRPQSRGGKGILTMKLTEKNGDIVSIKPVSDKDDLMVITNAGQVIRTKISGISLLGRNTQGVRLINLKPNEKVVAVEKIIEQEDVENNSFENENNETPDKN